MADLVHRFKVWNAATVVLAVLLLAGSCRAADSQTNSSSSKWITLTGCRFVPDGHRDGDSFHIKYGQQEFIMRLYFVDTPETDENFPERNKEQREYFQVTPEELRKAGEAARDLAADLLKKPFVVTTRWQNAMGRSNLPRYYAMVQVDGQDLAEILVSRGLARAKGTVAIPPSGGRARDRMDKLRKLEAEAKAKRVGVWATSTVLKK